MICRLISIRLVNATIQTIIENAPFVIVKHHTAKKQNGEYMNTGMVLENIQFARDAISGKNTKKNLCPLG
jgi:hypothetical protein